MGRRQPVSNRDRYPGAIVIQSYPAYLAKRLKGRFRRSVGTARRAEWSLTLVGRDGARALNEEEMRKRLEGLRIEHRDLDAAIDALTAGGATDQLQIARLKKRKLKLKDQIALIEDYLIPDIIA